MSRSEPPPDPHEAGSPRDSGPAPDGDPRRFVLEALALAIYGVYGLSWASAGTLLPTVMRDLALPLGDASLLATSVTCAKVTGPFVADACLARWGLARAYLVAALLVAAGGLVVVLPGYPAVIAARVVMGVGGAMAVVLFTPLAMRLFAPGERVVVNGLNYVGASMGTVVAMGLTPPLLQALDGSWRGVLGLYSLASLLLAGVWLLLARDPPPEGRTVASSSPQGLLEGLTRAARDPHTWILTWAGIGPLTAWVTIITYFPTFFRERAGESVPPWVQHLAVLPLLVGIPASLAGIVLARRLGRRLPLVRAAYGASVPLLVGVFTAPTPALPAVATLLGISLFVAMPAFYSIPQELPGATPDRAASTMACFWAAAYGATALCVWGAGRIAESHGFVAGFTLVAGVSAISAAGLFLLPETGPARARR